MMNICDDVVIVLTAHLFESSSLDLYRESEYALRIIHTNPTSFSALDPFPALSVLLTIFHKPFVTVNDFCDKR
jgi:hypothetical protein